MNASNRRRPIASVAKSADRDLRLVDRAEIIAEIIAVAKRESAMRERVYRGRLSSGKLDAAKAGRRIAVMAEIARTLRAEPMLFGDL